MKWNKIEDKEPLSFTELLVIVSYLNAPYEENGYNDKKAFWTEPNIMISSGYKHGAHFNWLCGGKVTHWMPLPELPIEDAKIGAYNFITMQGGTCE